MNPYESVSGARTEFAGGRASLESVAPSVNRCGTEKKPLNAASIQGLLYGGTDGTRTRDLRRDRPAF